ncbi:GNAT family N-acetyltransferase [Acidithrix sp. C25]|uniref:GNAT family N-acetyltransferase n=1 Tax=Acidithrix sp. C25 TaxID=1671482 RepID=UPI00191B9928|nr:GNAT family N-acetyltransferase [Acidithrix sp. C25]CAG4914868.1 unnamed protein product [Acidithrix sp. C25]
MISQAQGIARLTAHLQEFLGAWPPSAEGIEVIGSPMRTLPGWDGTVAKYVGVVQGNGAGVLSVPPSQLERFKDALNIAVERHGAPDALKHLPEYLELGDITYFSGIFRFTYSPIEFPSSGRWFDYLDPIVPTWLKPFKSEVLLALDEDGDYIAGVGVKHHGNYGREISVVTEERAQGRGLAKALVSQCARKIIDDGYVPTYLHSPLNLASSAVARAVGFNDLGWRIIGLRAV